MQFLCMCLLLLFHKNWPLLSLPVNSRKHIFICFNLKSDFESNLGEMCLVRRHTRLLVSFSVKNIFHQFPTYRYVELCRNGFSYWEHILSRKSRKTGNRKETTMEKSPFFFFHKRSCTNATLLRYFEYVMDQKTFANVILCISRDNTPYIFSIKVMTYEIRAFKFLCLKKVLIAFCIIHYTSETTFSGFQFCQMSICGIWTSRFSITGQFRNTFGWPKNILCSASK